MRSATTTGIGESRHGDGVPCGKSRGKRGGINDEYAP